MVCLGSRTNDSDGGLGPSPQNHVLSQPSQSHLTSCATTTFLSPPQWPLTVSRVVPVRVGGECTWTEQSFSHSYPPALDLGQSTSSGTPHLVCKWETCVNSEFWQNSVSMRCKLDQGKNSADVGSLVPQRLPASGEPEVIVIYPCCPSPSLPSSKGLAFSRPDTMLSLFWVGWNSPWFLGSCHG